MKPTRKTIYCCLKIILLQINLYLLLFQIKHALLLLPAGIIAYWILNDKEFESRLSFWYLLIVPILAMVSIRQFIIPSLLLSALLIVLIWPLEQKKIIPTISVVFLVGGAVLFSVFRFGKIIFQISPIMLYVVAAFLTIPILCHILFNTLLPCIFYDTSLSSKSDETINFYRVSLSDANSFFVYYYDQRICKPIA